MLLPLCLLLPLAQDGGQAAPAPEFRPLLAMRCGGVESWFVDDKDQALLRALRMFDERLNELPGEVPDFEVPPPALRLFTRLFSGPMALTVGMSSEAVPGMPMPFAGELRLTQGSAADAQANVTDIVNMMAEFGVPLDPPAAGAGYVLPSPVPMWMGESGDDVYIRLGLEGGAPAPDQAGLLPEGAEAYFTGMMAYGEFIDLATEASGGDQDLYEVQQVLALLGLDALNFEFAAGTDAERGYAVMRMPGWAADAQEAGLLSSEPLSQMIVTAIPEDATWATASSVDLGGMIETYAEMFATLGGEDGDVFAMIEAETGIDVRQDLIAPFGGQMAMYASDSTGGGGMLSTVAVVEIGDAEAWNSSWARFQEAVARMGREEAMGYVRMSGFADGGQEYDVLSFPGLPIPLELCVTTVGDFAVFGVTPQAARAAVYQLTVSERSLLENPDFKSQLPAQMQGVRTISWMNTPRLMQDGYGTLSLMCSMVSNAMRSPSDPSREPGLLLPSYAELRSGAKAMVSVGRVDGEDYVEESRWDRSQLVNMAGLIGYMYDSPVGPLVALGLGASVAVPNVMESTATAELAIAEARLAELELERQMEEELYLGIERIYAALDRFAANNGGRYPESLEVLVVLDENGASYLQREDLVDPWGDAYLYEPPVDEDDEPYVTFQE